MKTVNEFIEKSARAGLLLQNKDGSMPAGHNGPWNDLETPIRNTSHWLISYIKAFDISGDKKFIHAAHGAADYISNLNARPLKAAFHLRKNPLKNGSNGLVGQAWTLEGLAIASKVLKRPELHQLAEEVFLQHDFDHTYNLWRVLNVDGTYGDIMKTINQQIWFAAAGAIILKSNIPSPEIDLRIRKFLTHLPERLQYTNHEIIQHNTSIKNSKTHQIWHAILSLVKIRSARDRMLSIGYHTFNLYGLAILKQHYHEHKLWSNQKIQKACNTLLNKKYLLLAKDNPYAFAYNPAGIEAAFSIFVFYPEKEELIKFYLTHQFFMCYNTKNNFMELGGAKDPVTLAARIYEATRLPNIEISLETSL